MAKTIDTVRRAAVRIGATALALLASSGALAAVSMTSAHAATLWHVDPTGDVHQYDQDGEELTVSKNSWNDIIGIGASYTAPTLRVGSSIRGYRHRDGRWGVGLLTSKGEEYRVTSPLNKGSDGSDYLYLQRGTPGIGGEVVTVECEGLRLTRSERGISVSIPTGCLGSPWRVRIGVFNDSFGRFVWDDQGFQDGRRDLDPEQSGYVYSAWLPQG